MSSFKDNQYNKKYYSYRPFNSSGSNYSKPAYSYRFQDYKHTMFWWIGGSILLFVLLYIIRNIFKETFNKPAVLDDFFQKTKVEGKVKGESRGETLCRKIAEKIFEKPFVKVRPEFLKNNVTGKNLELDIYNEELKIAIEYDGQQHTKYVPFFHKNYEDFLNQRYRDEIKKMLCKQNGINLISINYDVPDADIETTIRLQAKHLGYNV
jgi:hypothetical protein